MYAPCSARSASAGARPLPTARSSIAGRQPVDDDEDELLAVTWQGYAGPRTARHARRRRTPMTGSARASRYPTTGMKARAPRSGERRARPDRCGQLGAAAPDAPRTNAPPAPPSDSSDAPPIASPHSPSPRPTEFRPAATRPSDEGAETGWRERARDEIAERDAQAHRKADPVPATTPPCTAPDPADV